MAIYMKLIPNLTNIQIKRFWGYVDIPNQLINKNKCWLWSKYKDICGYGKFVLGGKTYNSHRIAYMLANPNWNQTTYVCHKCDNPQCCNPNHLFAGTAKDNVIDRDKKGRGKLPNQAGSNHSRTKLTEKDIIAIRNKYAKGIKQGIIAQQYNIVPCQISRIVNHKRWSHI
jgi:hypothetical protein